MEADTAGPARTLLILSQVYVPDPASVGQHMHDVAAEMARRGWRVQVLTSARGYDDPLRRYPASEQRDGVRIRRFRLSSFGKGSITLRLLGGALFLLQSVVYALFVPRVRCLLVSTSPPMCSIAGLFLARVKRAPLKFWAMDINPDQLVALGKTSPTSLPARLFDALNRRLLKRAADVVALDRFMARRLESKVPTRVRMSVIPPWPHIERVDEILPHSENPFRDRQRLIGKFVVMYSGNLSPSHPIKTILEAALRLRDEPDLLFLFIGGGLGRREVEQLIEEYEPANVRLLPYQPLSELRASLSAADVHLVAMGNQMVGVVHPCKVYGAMAVGRPVLLLGPSPCHVSDILERYDVGWQIAHGDVDGAVRRIRELMRSEPGELERRGHRAQRAVAEQFHRSKLCGQFCDVLERGTQAVEDRATATAAS